MPRPGFGSLAPLLAAGLLAAGSSGPCRPARPQVVLPAVREPPDELRRRHTAAVEDPADDARFQAYLEVLPRLGERYLMEGDVLASAVEVREALVALHVARTEPPAAPVPPSPAPPPPAPGPAHPAGSVPHPAGPVGAATPGAAAATPVAIPTHPSTALAAVSLRRRLDLGARLANRLQGIPSLRGREKAAPCLKIETTRGAALFWGDPAQRTLVAEVDEASFATASGGRAAIAAALEEAGRGWSALCPDCGVRFATASASADPPGAVRFKVAYFPEDVAGALAIAFTPRAAPADRVLWILPPFYGGSTPPAGALRHELGHILGYLHEQVGTASVCGEVGPGEWKRLTDDDPNSVMHYYCGPKEVADLRFSRLDCLGHHEVYGEGVPKPDCLGPW